jgi:hypothetical protein
MTEGKVPLKTILLKFIAHVDDLEKKFADGDDQYDREFQVCLQIVHFFESSLMND